MIVTLKWPMLIGIAFLAGCANVPREAGFGSVQKDVMERTGHQVHWDQGTESDKQVADTIRSHLQKELTVDSAVQIALLKNQNLQATYEELGIAQAELVEAGLLRNPTLTAEVRFPDRPKLPVEIEVTQSVLDLLLIPLRKRAAGAAFEGAKLRVTNEVLNTAAETKIAFYRAQAAEQMVDMHRTISKATEASADAAKGLHDAGNITDLTFAQEKDLHEQAKIELAKAEAEALAAREDLNILMGVWGSDTAWTIASRLPELPNEELDSRGIESLAIRQRSDLAAAREDVRATAASLGLTKSTALVSDVTVHGHYQRESDGTDTTGPGIELPLPIFNQGQPAVFAATARLRQSQKRYAALAVEIRAQARRARDRLIAARDRSNYLRLVILPLRHQIVQQTLLQYNAMQAGVFQLLEAKKNEIEAGRQYVESLREYWVARAELERAVGGRIISLAASTQPTSMPAMPQTQPPSDQDHQHNH